MLQKIKNLQNVTVKFVIVGLIGFVSNYAVLHTLADRLDVNVIVSEILAIVFALQVTFVLHDNWTYVRQSAQKSGLKISLRSRYVLYLVSNGFSSSSTVAIFSILVMFIHNNFIVLFLATIVQTTWNYIINRFVIWKKNAI